MTARLPTRPPPEWDDPCRRYAPDISAFLDGELDDGEAAAVWAHLQACAACAATYEDMRRIQQAVRTYAVFPTGGKPLRERVMKALAREEP